MNYQITLSANDILLSLGVGCILCLIYLYLLWQTIIVSQKSNHPTLILFLSGVLRIFLLIFIALVFSKNNLGKFLLIFCGFLLTRVITLKLVKPSFKNQLKDKEIVSYDGKKPTKKSTSKRKKTKRK